MLPHFTPVNDINSLSYSTVFSIYQDELGVMWMNTNNGLVRYNGNRFDYTGLLLGMKPINGDGKGHIYAQTNNAIIEYNIYNYTYKKVDTPDEINIQSACFHIGKKEFWVGSDNSIYKREDNVIRNYISLDKDVYITALLESHEGLIVGTRKNGLFIIDSQKNIRNLKHIDSEISSIFEDSNNNIWIGTWTEGAYCIKKNTDIEHFSTFQEGGNQLSDNFVRVFSEDRHNNIWIATMNGINIFNPRTRQISLCNLPVTTTQQSVWSIMKDKQGGMWVGTFYGGVYYSNPNADIFMPIEVQSDKTDKLYLVNKIIEDKRNDLWICSDGAGLIHIDCKNKTSQQIQNQSSNKTKSIYYDSSNDALWVGTHLGGLNKYDIASKKWTYYSISDSPDHQKKEVINDIVPYKGLLFLGTHDGVYLFDPQTGKSTQTGQLKSYNKLVYSLLIDDNILWIAAGRLYKYEIEKDLLSRHLIQEPNARLIEFVRIFKDGKNELWGLTLGDGFLSLKDSLKICNNETIGIANNFISSINETNDGKFVIGTNKGVSVYDPENNYCINYDSNNGFPLSSMRSGCILKRKNGELILGGIDGITTFLPHLLNFSSPLPHIRFDKLWINSKEVKPEDENTEIISPDKGLDLSYKQNSISIEIATNDYTQETALAYEYRLQNINNSWIPFDLKSPISFTNLSPGKYNLQVRVSSIVNDESGEPINFPFHISPPWYASWYAYLCYIIVITALLIWVFYYFWQKMVFKTTLEQQEIATKSKFRFFTHISHEFRTPLTLVIGQLEMLMQNNKFIPSIHKGMIAIYSQSVKMQNLIGQLLDFEKQSQGHFILRVREQDIIAFVDEIFLSFKSYANSRNIDFRFISVDDSIPVFFDNLQLQKVINNLLNNAFKFTAKGGSIVLEIRSDEHDLIISVEDTGIGISEKSIPHIFNDFYQDVNEDSPNYHQGTGIGLALSKSIIELHHGNISVKSELNKGSVFKVHLPLGNTWFKDDSRVEILEQNNDKTYDTTIASLITGDDTLNIYPPTEQAELPSILLIEDEENLRKMLVEIFSPMYNTIEASDGIEGYDKALALQPDIIVSDIMMPDMDGRTLCTKLKKDFNTCHIPIILLTAQTTIEQNIEGLKCGADDYITKPFNIRILVTRCNNLLHNRKVLRDKFQKHISASPDIITSNEQDQEFIHKILSIVENNLYSEEFDVSTLCKEILMSKTMLSIKIKGITGQTPGEFIQTVRLKKAAWMIKNKPDKNIAEIAYELGFSSPKYFRIRFKKQFGISPSGMKEEQSKDNI